MSAKLFPFQYHIPDFHLLSVQVDDHFPHDFAIRDVCKLHSVARERAVAELPYRFSVSRIHPKRFKSTAGGGACGRLPYQQFGRTYVVNEDDLKLVQDRKPGRPPKPKEEKTEKGSKKGGRR